MSSEIDPQDTPIELESPDQPVELSEIDSYTHAAHLETAEAQPCFIWTCTHTPPNWT